MLLVIKGIGKSVVRGQNGFGVRADVGGEIDFGAWVGPPLRRRHNSAPLRLLHLGTAPLPRPGTPHSSRFQYQRISNI